MLLISWPIQGYNGPTKDVGNTALQFGRNQEANIDASAGVLAKSLLSCLTLWDPVDRSPPVSPVHGILQAGILEWVAMTSSRGSSQPRDRTQVSCIVGGLFTNRAITEAQLFLIKYFNKM